MQGRGSIDQSTLCVRVGALEPPSLPSANPHSPPPSLTHTASPTGREIARSKAMRLELFFKTAGELQASHLIHATLRTHPIPSP